MQRQDVHWCSSGHLTKMADMGLKEHPKCGKEQRGQKRDISRIGPFSTATCKGISLSPDHLWYTFLTFPIDASTALLKRATKERMKTYILSDP